ncbi:WD40 repeat domain-containing protein [Geomonas anaerohicana]|uniref:6-bladed beta-propeller protein n=1 Tax=Geomonas anaerohicana TaxID=2798583 RepID=A0ABS0YDW5_9BACT|nr:hypothetical protein [Geomonas anaerohicana]MBJ6750472.1 hypothetical protein [Geomonas anaerohicana]
MKKLVLTLFTVLILGSLTGCAATLPVQLPTGLQVKPIARSDAGTPFDATRNGTFATVVKGSVALTDLQGKSVKVLDGAVSALSFSPGGDRLAVALPAEDGTWLRILDGSGRTLGETKIGGRITSVAWRSEKEVLAGVLNVRKFSFGSQMTSRLFQWDGSGVPVATTLNDVTLRPHVAGLPDQLLYNQLFIAVSPYRDEIAYTTLKDPPLFTPYLKVLIRNIETGGGAEVGQVQLGEGKVVYAPDGESLLIGDAENAARRVSLPDGKELESFPSAAVSPALSPAGSYLLLDGHLYRKGKEIATFPAGTRGVFLPDGSAIAVSYQGQLYLVSGLDDGPVPALPADLERLLKLRRLRSQKLITDQEYHKQLERKEPMQ